MKLTLTVDLDTVEQVPGTGKYSDYTFFNNKQSRYQAIEATDAAGNVFQLKTLYIKPVASVKTKGADAKSGAASAVTARIEGLENKLDALLGMMLQEKASKPLKTGRVGVAPPQTSVLAPSNGHAK